MGGQTPLWPHGDGSPVPDPSTPTPIGTPGLSISSLPLFESKKKYSVYNSCNKFSGPDNQHFLKMKVNYLSIETNVPNVQQ